ncbi:MAG: S41 family peptidase [Cyanobacteria bacterium J06621_8]
MSNKIFALLFISSYLFISSFTSGNNNNQNKYRINNSTQKGYQVDDSNNLTNYRANLKSSKNQLSNFQYIVQANNSYRELIDDAWQVVNIKFVDSDFNGVNWLAIRDDYLNRSYKDLTAAYAAIEEMLDLLGDPFTRFITPEEYQGLNRNRNDNTTGIGLSFNKDKITQEIKVSSALPGSPAAIAGITYDDVITHIDEQNISGMNLGEVKSLLRGKLGTEVKLSINRDEHQINFRVRRVKFNFNRVDSQIKEVNERQISYIRLNQFSSGAAEEVRQAIKNSESQQVAGYVLDLRANIGGLFFSAIEITRMWLRDGIIVHSLSRGNEIDTKSAIGNALTDKPLVILVDRASASASEIMAAALQENSRATILGEQTHGHGSLHSVHQLSNGSAVAVTVSMLLTTNKNEIQDLGIQPDLIVEPSESQLIKLKKDPSLLGTEEDLMWTRAIEVLQQKY